MYKVTNEINVDSEGQEIRPHGTLAYPVASYYNDMNNALVIWHWHEELELIYVTKGVVRVGVGSVEKTLTVGDGCFINSNVAHTVCKVDSRGGIINSIVFHPKLIGGRHSIYWQKYLKPLIENEERQFIAFDSMQSKDSQIISLIQLAWQAEADETPGYEFEVRNLLSQVILLLSEGKSGKPYSPTPKELRDMERTKQMITFMENHFTDELTIKQIASVAALSEGECLRCFKRSTGLSPIQFLKDYRLIRAAELIRSTNQQISDIATQCGFLDMSYFAKSFKQAFGDTPTTYRTLGLSDHRSKYCLMRRAEDLE
ncbi:MAG: helix-turn-helix transcriptional regulator [Selenomonadaceae bacterium]|nr:helix-turn-helix transcriptional regulator [Selenomonadaceae bacterium]